MPAHLKTQLKFNLSKLGTRMQKCHSAKNSLKIPFRVTLLKKIAGYDFQLSPHRFPTLEIVDPKSYLMKNQRVGQSY